MIYSVRWRLHPEAETLTNQKLFVRSNETTSCVIWPRNISIINIPVWLGFSTPDAAFQCMLVWFLQLLLRIPQYCIAKVLRVFTQGKWFKELTSWERLFSFTAINMLHRQKINRLNNYKSSCNTSFIGLTGYRHWFSTLFCQALLCGWYVFQGCLIKI